MSGLERWQSVAAAIDHTIPEDHKRRIAIVGAGTIVEVAHLPAYRLAGLEVVGLFDLDHERASRVAKEFGIETVYDSLEELLADERVAVVDVAVLVEAQPDIVRQAIAAGKHLLCQKPFVQDLQVGRELIELADAAGRHNAPAFVCMAGAG